MTQPSKPLDLLIYYGWLNGFNNAANQWNNELVAQDLAKYDQLVLGDGLQDPGHGDFANTQIILSRIKEFNPAIQIFGYVSANQSLADFAAKADLWDNLEICGIFIDEAGYDFGNNRDDLNTKFIHVKNLEFANICFVNSWNMDHIIGIYDDPNFPNSTFNPYLHESALDEDDWYLLESFSVNTTAYTANGGYAPQNDWYIRGSKAAKYREDYGINISSVGVIDNGNIKGQELFDFCYYSSLMFSLNSNGSSDTYYGASSASVEYYQRPGVNSADRNKNDLPAVVQNGMNVNEYLRYCIGKKLFINFTIGNQSAGQIKY